MKQTEMASKNKTLSQNGKRERKGLEKGLKVDSCMLTMRSLRDLAEKEAKLVQQALTESNLIDPGYILELTKSIHSSGNKNISDYISRNTEILLNEHSSVVRQKVIQKMKQQIQDMSTEMSQDSQKLSEDISDFFDFIQSNYESALASFQRVLEVAKNNYEKVDQLNKMEDQIFVLRSELQELEQQLLECLMCYAFLSTIAPQENAVDKDVLPKQFLRSFGPRFTDEDFEIIQREVLEDILTGRKIIEPIEGNVDVMKFIEHFKDSNLALVHPSLLSSSSRKVENHSAEKMQEELHCWEGKITNAHEELDKAKEMYKELQNQMSNLSDENAEKIKSHRESELRNITEIYKLFTGSDAKFMDIALMKVAIDSSMEKLFNELDAYPKRKVKELLKMLDAEKKLSERKVEEALRAQRASERMKRSNAKVRRHRKKST